MARKITESPSNLAYHIVRSVPHDTAEVRGRRLTLTRDGATMVCICAPGEDVHATVTRGEEGYSFSANETDTISRAWDRV